MSKQENLSFDGEETGAGYAAPAMDMIAAAVLLLLAGWYTWEAFTFRMPGGWRTGPGLVPAAAGITLMLMAAALAITAWQRRNRPAVAAMAAEEDAEAISDPRRTALLIGIVFAYLLAMSTISFGLSGYVAGFYLIFGAFEIATILCLSALMRLFWPGSLWVIAGIAIGWTAFLSLTFRNIFQISLPG